MRRGAGSFTLIPCVLLSARSILQLACVACEDNQEHMKKHEGMVQLHLSLPLTAPDTLAAIYEDNMQMVRAPLLLHARSGNGASVC